MHLRVITFNVRGSFHEDGDNNWPHRRALNIQTILQHDPDLIGLQEAQSGNLADYETGLADYAAELGPLSIRQIGNYHRVPIYWKRGRFERLDGGGFYLSDTPDSWSLSWGSTLVRAATWVRLRARASGITFVMLNTHFPHEPESHKARAESAKLVIRQLAQIAGPDMPQIVMADFNALPGSEAYQTFIQEGYIDAFTATGHTESASTFHGFLGADFEDKTLRIDWILTRSDTRELHARRCEIITDATPPLYPSDHYPVLAEVEIV